MAKGSAAASSVTSLSSEGCASWSFSYVAWSLAYDAWSSYSSSGGSSSPDVSSSGAPYEVPRSSVGNASLSYSALSYSATSSSTAGTPYSSGASSAGAPYPVSALASPGAAYRLSGDSCLPARCLCRPRLEARARGSFSGRALATAIAMDATFWKLKYNDEF